MTTTLLYRNWTSVFLLLVTLSSGQGALAQATDAEIAAAKAAAAKTAAASNNGLVPVLSPKDQIAANKGIGNDNFCFEARNNYNKSVAELAKTCGEAGLGSYTQCMERLELCSPMTGKDISAPNSSFMGMDLGGQNDLMSQCSTDMDENEKNKKTETLDKALKDEKKDLEEKKVKSDERTKEKKTALEEAQKDMLKIERDRIETEKNRNEEKAKQAEADHKADSEATGAIMQANAEIAKNQNGMSLVLRNKAQKLATQTSGIIQSQCAIEATKSANSKLGTNSGAVLLRFMNKRQQLTKELYNACLNGRMSARSADIVAADGEFRRLQTEIENSEQRIHSARKSISMRQETRATRLQTTQKGENQEDLNYRTETFQKAQKMMTLQNEMQTEQSRTNLELITGNVNVAQMQNESARLKSIPVGSKRRRDAVAAMGVKDSTFSALCNNPHCSPENPQICEKNPSAVDPSKKELKPTK